MYISYRYVYKDNFDDFSRVKTKRTKFHYNCIMAKMDEVQTLPCFAVIRINFPTIQIVSHTIQIIFQEHSQLFYNKSFVILPSRVQRETSTCSILSYRVFNLTRVKIKCCIYNSRLVIFMTSKPSSLVCGNLLNQLSVANATASIFNKN